MYSLFALLVIYSFTQKWRRAEHSPIEQVPD